MAHQGADSGGKGCGEGGGSRGSSGDGAVIDGTTTDTTIELCFQEQISSMKERTAILMTMHKEEAEYGAEELIRILRDLCCCCCASDGESAAEAKAAAYDAFVREIDLDELGKILSRSAQSHCNDYKDPVGIVHTSGHIRNLLFGDDDKPIIATTAAGVATTAEELPASSFAMFQRVLDEGNWRGARKWARTLAKKKDIEHGHGHGHEEKEGEEEEEEGVEEEKEEMVGKDCDQAHGGGVSPWIVLVTGCNGIRKTTTVHQHWFADLLAEALVEPLSSPAAPTSSPAAKRVKKKEEDRDDHTTSTATTTRNTVRQGPRTDDMPTGKNSFFRQLDHLVATLGAREFEFLYSNMKKATDCIAASASTASRASILRQNPKLMACYTELKAAIFTRYRAIAEVVGRALAEKAVAGGMNVMVETSGRSINSWAHMETLQKFSASKKVARGAENTPPRLLALRFTVPGIEPAQHSVDARMIKEACNGMCAQDIRGVVRANEGGPYGSGVLPEVRTAGDRVWKEFEDQLGPDGVRHCDYSSEEADHSKGRESFPWYTATIQITPHNKEPWTACAVRPDGSNGTVYKFPPQRPL